jgi:beta-lactamase class A
MGMDREGYGERVITAPPPAPPAVEQPAPYELSFGAVAGTVAPGTRRVVVRAGGKVLADLPLRRRRFQLRVRLPIGETSVQVVTVDGKGRHASATVAHVLGAPQTAAPRRHAARLDGLLARDVRRAAVGFGPKSGIYVENLASGAGAAWNAKATFPAASTLKLAIAVTALARTEGTPRHGSTLDGLVRQMIVFSDNASANAVERYFGGSTSGGSALVNALMRSIGLVDTEMYGGYEIDTYGVDLARLPAAAIPLRVESQPSWGYGKRTSAWDLASLAKSVWLASAGSPLRSAQPGFTAGDARYLLYVLAQVRDPGKLGREVGRVPGVRVLHKAGWIGAARHDNGIVLWPGGAYVAAVMTYRAAGAGTQSDVLAGRVARIALDRSGVGIPTSNPPMEGLTGNRRFPGTPRGGNPRERVSEPRSEARLPKQVGGAGRRGRPQPQTVHPRARSCLRGGGRLPRR